ncbi:MAG: tetratricopeptide repeat protein, partial [Bacteroidota bacterium]
VKKFNRAIELNENQADLYDYRGYVYLHLYKFHKAIKDFNKALEIEPWNAEILVHRGIANYCIRHFMLAIRDYTMAIEMNPNMSKAYYNRGILKLELGDRKGARQDFIAASELLHDGASRLLAELE